jgi:hypothetical protein
VLHGIRENQNGGKITANTGNFRKEPQRITLLLKVQFHTKTVHLSKPNDLYFHAEFFKIKSTISLQFQKTKMCNQPHYMVIKCVRTLLIFAWLARATATTNWFISGMEIVEMNQ